MTTIKRCIKMGSFLTLVFLFVGVIPLFAQSEQKPVIGILGAFPAEIKIIKKKISGVATKIMGINFIKGEFAGRQIVLAFTGIGKVNAAMTTTLLLDHFKPEKVIFTGVAGGINPNLSPGDIVIAEKLAQHDLGEITSKGFKIQSYNNPVTGKKNPIFFASEASLVKLAQQVAEKIKFTVPIGTKDRKVKVIKGIVVTGDVFVSSKKKTASLVKEFNADAVEMEGAAVAQVCFQQGVPFVVLRSISDNADHSANFNYEQFYEAAAKNSAALTMALIKELPNKSSQIQK